MQQIVLPHIGATRLEALWVEQTYPPAKGAAWGRERPLLKDLPKELQHT